MWDNKLFNDTMTVGGDHIVPYDAAKHLIKKVGSTDKEEVMLKGGHVSLVAGPNAVRRLWPKLDSWLGGRST
jgi:polyhydroxyalkanoate synthase